MNYFINVNMLRHPINYVIVWVVLLIASFAYREIHKGLAACACNDIPD